MGNSGDLGYFSLNGECTSKNSLCVGASVSAATSFTEAPSYTDVDSIITEFNNYLCVLNRFAQNYNLTCDAQNKTELTRQMCCAEKAFQLICCPDFVAVTSLPPEFQIDEMVWFSIVDSRVKPVFPPSLSLFPFFPSPSPILP